MTTASEDLAALAAAAKDAASVVETKLLRLPGNAPPWTDAGMALRAGESVTWLAAGRVVVSAEADLTGGPTFYLWARVGERGTIFKGVRDTHTFRAAADGRLFLATYQGEWGTREGGLATPVEAYATVGGGFDVLVVRWKAGAREGLDELARRAPGSALVRAERERLDRDVRKPEGWEYLWFLGDGEIFRRSSGNAISVHTREDVGILQKKVSFPLAADTSLSWRWKVERLPSSVAEDTVLTHDYLSIAVEFENGLDLTYYWSAALPEETHFACPLPTWNARETHLVARSGGGRLGEWLTESRDVSADYRKAIGEPPREIVGIWLIAVSVFRRGEGRAEFGGIALTGGGRQLAVV